MGSAAGAGHRHSMFTSQTELWKVYCLLTEIHSQKESVERKEIIPFQDFSTRSETIHDKTWNITPWRIFIWSLRQLGLTGGLSGEDKLPVGRFVLLSNVEVGRVLKPMYRRFLRLGRKLLIMSYGVFLVVI